MSFKKLFLFLFLFLNVVQSDVCFAKRTKKKNQLSIKAEHKKKSKGYLFVCTCCLDADGKSEEFEDKEDLLKHVCKKHLKRKYKKDFVDTMYKKRGRWHCCKKCDYENKNKEHVKKHIGTKHCYVGHKCKKCGHVYTSSNGIYYHINKMNCQKNKIEEIERSDSDEEFKESEEELEKLEEEYELEEAGYSYVCICCYGDEEKDDYDEFEDKESVLEHVCDEHLDQEYTEDLMSTMCKKSKKKFQCEICNKKFSSASNAERHIEGIHYFVGVACDVCGRVYRSKSAYQLHKRKGVCSKQDPEGELVEKEHDDDIVEEEILLDQDENQENTVEQVDQSDHEPDRDFLYVCFCCIDEKKKSDEFEKREDLLKHLCKQHLKIKYCDDVIGVLYESQEDEYKCMKCEHKEVFESNMKKHLEKHCKIGYKCCKCDFSYKTKRSFDRHLESEVCVNRQQKKKNKENAILDFVVSDKKNKKAIKKKKNKLSVKEKRDVSCDVINTINQDENTVDGYNVCGFCCCEKGKKRAGLMMRNAIRTDVDKQALLKHIISEHLEKSEKSKALMKSLFVENRQKGLYYCKICGDFFRKEKDVIGHLVKKHFMVTAKKSPLGIRFVQNFYNELEKLKDSLKEKKHAE